MFKKYQKVARCGYTEVDGIINGTVWVFPKLDGTNGSVWYNKDKDIINCGSRNRKLSDVNKDNDNAGFCAYIRSEDRFTAFFKKYPSLRLYGEWLVPHTIRHYKEDSWNKFYVFDVVDDSLSGKDTEHYLKYEEYLPLLEEFGIDYIPAIARIRDPKPNMLQSLANRNNYLIDSEDKSGEGVVLKNYDYTNRFGKIVWAKVLSEEFAQTAGVKPNRLEDDTLELEIAREFCTMDLINKERAKIMNRQDGEWTNKNIPELLGRVWHEFLVEELPHIIKKKKNPTINFKLLNKSINKVVSSCALKCAGNRHMSEKVERLATQTDRAVKCSKCGNYLRPSYVDGYNSYCAYCDEDFGYSWFKTLK